MVEGVSLDDSAYSYYTEKTDLNEDTLAQSYGGTTPDKLAKSLSFTNNVGTENA